jgi:arsenate reductase
MSKILFVCTGNSCRSQIAEGFGRLLSDGKHEIKSAGTSPIGILPETIATMREAAVDITHQKSKLLTKSMLEWADYVITLCGSARDACPALPPGIKHLHWEIDNPDRYYHSREAQRKEFARVRDQIKALVKEFLDRLDGL